MGNLTYEDSHRRYTKELLEVDGSILVNSAGATITLTDKKVIEDLIKKLK